MALSIPRYIQETGIVEAPIQYKWPDSPFDAYGEENPRFENKLVKISDRGVVAFSAGIAEWIAWRLIKHTNDPMLFNYIEAVWAAIVDWTYMDPKNNPEDKLEWDDFDGPILEPLCAATMKMGEIIFLVSDEQPITDDGVSMANLLEFVLPNTKSFREWRNWAIEQLRRLTPRISEDDSLGVPVPREALDPQFDFKPDMTAKLIDSYLKTLDYKKNPYLQSPEKMKKTGFKGTAYRYSGR